MFNRSQGDKGNKGDVVADARRVIEVISSPASSQSDLQPHLERMMEHAEQATSAYRDAAVAVLAEAIPTLPTQRAGFLSVVTGALIEHGADTTPAAEPILARATAALAAAVPFVEACEAARASGATPADVHEHEHHHDHEGHDHEHEHSVVELYGEQVAATMPENAEAFAALPYFQAAAIAILSRSKALRKRVHADTTLREHVLRLEDVASLEYLAQMVRVLDDEEIVVLHPASRRGYLVRISGIGLNFELHTLLADALIGDEAQGWLPGERPDSRVVAIARGAPFDPQNEPTAHGAFNLMNWFGLEPDGTVAEGLGMRGAQMWIWNEGVPDDIVPFEGTRVILLTPPPYARTWNAGRAFPDMPGELEVVRQLAPDEVRGWLERLAAAPHPAPPA